mgnify:CR=1 FL=1
MRPVLFHIGSYPVYSYGVMLFTAFLAGVLVAAWELRRRGLDGSVMYTVGAVAAISGVFGARLFYVLGHLDQFSGRWGSVFDLNMRGLVYYGGLFVAVPACVLTVRRLKVPTGAVADAVGLAMPLSLAVARVGCFLNGCCGGKPSGLPWAVTFPGSNVAVHPTQLYELVVDLAVFCFLLWARRKLRRGWDLFLLSVACYGAARFAVEFFRYHSNASAGIFFQVVSALLFCAGISTVFFREIRKVEEASEFADMDESGYIDSS